MRMYVSPVVDFTKANFRLWKESVWQVIRKNLVTQVTKGVQSRYEMLESEHLRFITSHQWENLIHTFVTFLSLCTNMFDVSDNAQKTCLYDCWQQVVDVRQIFLPNYISHCKHKTVLPYVTSMKALLLLTLLYVRLYGNNKIQRLLTKLKKRKQHNQRNWRHLLWGQQTCLQDRSLSERLWKSVTRMDRVRSEKVREQTSF